ncbi:hypothetical protein FOXB_13636 [Fusarium oxysporum f. sp. conglutinans Fo5176]|uniref:Uncharacterized protein n=1 Tax=Fusarium oxysporum (strain Fo5176) TaxID=660025 RepID=F9G4Q4_FUSOF|nr:hypothetical protein FOXB_13636 [Fusarium oxysporum f. sp. conglutinans Fo5176]
MPLSSTLTVFSGLIQPYSSSRIFKYQLADLVFAQCLVISLLTEEGFDATSKLAMRESVAEGHLPQNPTNKAVLLTGGKMLL